MNALGKFTNLDTRSIYVLAESNEKNRSNFFDPWVVIFLWRSSLIPFSSRQEPPLGVGSKQELSGFEARVRDLVPQETYHM